MRAISGGLGCAAFLCLALPAAFCDDAVPIQKARTLANQGQVDKAIDVLRGHLDKNSHDSDARLFLGSLLDFDGRPDDAIKLYEAGLTGRAVDFPLLIEIAETQQRLGEEGPSITRRRGMITASPNRDPAGAEKFKQERLAKAVAAYEKALKLVPGEAKATKALASVYTAQKKPDAAIALWSAMVKAEPKNGSNQLALGLVLREAGRADDATLCFKQAIDLEPRLAEAYEALADYQKSKGQLPEATESRKRATYYGSLPPFSKLEYSEDNARVLRGLGQESIVRDLVADTSDSATEFLAVLCWRHPHNQLETQAFEALETRGAKTTPILREMLNGARSTCTIRSAAHILARRKADGLLDRMVKLLPGDMQGFGMDMDVAGILDDLGDARAVLPLVQVLSADGKGANGDGPLSDRAGARARAALALGAFDKAEAKQALEAAQADKEIAPFCLASLYRLSKDPKYLASLEQSVGPDDDYVSYVIGNYLLKKARTEPVERLAQTWKKRRDLHRAAEDAKKKSRAAEDGGKKEVDK